MSSRIEISLVSGDERHALGGVSGETIHHILTADDDTVLEAPCGGKGRCGKCKVRILEGSVGEPTDQERKLLSAHELETGVRLSCLTQATENLTVEIRRSAAAQILVQGIDFDTKLQPNVRKSYIEMTEPSLQDQRDDLRRVQDALVEAATDTEVDTPPNPASYRMPLEELVSLPAGLRENEFRVTAVHDRNYIISIEGGDTTGANYGIGVDIGTTTVVAYLIDLTTGERVDVASGLNAQKAHGQDVISRINFTIQEEGGIELLRKRIINQLNSMIGELTKRNSIDVENIYSITLAGNTTMMHLAAGLPPKHIATVPFIPVAKKRMTFLARELGIAIPKGASAYLLPSISAYVGADIVAAVLASGLFAGEALSLLIDIGTNGEIVLGDRNRMICCSTAAGPAFEGATIRHGVGGIAGAINTVRMERDNIEYTTIADARPLGICGSGIIDAVAALLDAGLVDETGRLEAKEGYEAIMREVDGQPAVELATAADSDQGEAIVLEQRDVREVQLAKASIAAGIATLLAEAGKTPEDIDVVYLAGGFGSFIDKQNAIRIGLIPAVLEDRIQVIGNAAGTGAVLSLMSETCLAECDRIAGSAEYIELSSSLAFQTAYVEEMSFPVEE